jgi:hypothetical protein
MPSDFEQLIETVRHCTREQKQRVFQVIRDSVSIHQEIEREFNIQADLILDAISRAGSLTKRGIRGVIAETVFAQEIVPTLQGWHDDTPEGDHPYDSRLSSGTRSVRVQVKMQRRERGQPLTRAGQFVVEVQRTRTGTKAVRKPAHTVSASLIFWLSAWNLLQAIGVHSCIYQPPLYNLTLAIRRSYEPFSQFPPSHPRTGTYELTI